MTMPVPLGLTPYISPATLTQASTGVDYSSIPATPNFDPQANNSELWNICQRATAMADQYCNQVLRATLDTEVMRGPDYRVTVGPQAGGAYPTPYWGNAGSNARMIMSRWPVLAVNGIKVSPNNFPRNWVTVPANNYEPELPPYGIFNSVAPGDDAYGGQAIIMGAGYVGWNYGRNGYVLQVSYTNGWPHTSLTTVAPAGAETISVADTTGWAVSNYEDTVTGATGVFKDGGQQEAGSVVSASTTSGPGTLTLSSPLQFTHQGGVVFSTLPGAIEQACILFGAGQALVRGATTTTIHAIGGHAQSSGADFSELNLEGEILLHPFRRSV